MGVRLRTAVVVTMTVLGLASPVRAGEPVTLAQAVEKATTTHPLVQAAREGLAEFEGKLTAAKLSWLPKVTVSGFVSGTPGKWGDPMNGGTEYGWESWRPYIRGELTGVLPLYTFGKLSNLKEMARHGVDIGGAQVQVAQSTIEMMVLEAYLGLQLSTRMADILAEGEKYLRRARTYLEKLRDEDDEEYDDVDMLRLKVYESEVSGRRLDAQRLERLSLDGLGLLTGYESKSFLPAGKMTVFSMELDTLDSYFQLAYKSRGELKALRSLQLAQQARVSLEKSRFYPDFFFAGYYTYARAWSVEEQGSPFAYDPFNSWFGGGGLGFKLSLDLASRIGGLDEQRATGRKLAAQAKAYRQKVTMDVATAYAEVQDLKKKIGLARTAHKAARGWLIAKMDLYESGFAEMRDLADALSAFFKRRLEHDQAVMNYNLAVARLAAACGVSVRAFTKIE